MHPPLSLPLLLSLDPPQLIPGFTGCSLEAKLTKKKSSFPLCPADTEDYEVMWLEQNQLEVRSTATSTSFWDHFP